MRRLFSTGRKELGRCIRVQATPQFRKGVELLRPRVVFLEGDSQTELRLPRRNGLACDPAKRCRRVNIQSRVARREVVKDIGELKARSNANALLDLEVLAQCQVHVPNAGTAQIVVATATAIHPEYASPPPGDYCGWVGKHVELARVVCPHATRTGNAIMD